MLKEGGVGCEGVVGLGVRSPSDTQFEGKYPVCPSFSPFHHPSFFFSRTINLSPEWGFVSVKLRSGLFGETECSIHDYITTNDEVTLIMKISNSLICQAQQQIFSKTFIKTKLIISCSFEFELDSSHDIERSCNRFRCGLLGCCCAGFLLFLLEQLINKRFSFYSLN